MFGFAVMGSHDADLLLPTSSRFVADVSIAAKFRMFAVSFVAFLVPKRSASLEGSATSAMGCQSRLWNADSALTLRFFLPRVALAVPRYEKNS